jgi:gustatory receptor
MTNFPFLVAMRVGKCFGLFPLDIDVRDCRKISFKWMSLRTMFSLIFIISSSLTALCVLKEQVKHGPLTASNIIGIIFFTSCSIVCIIFFRISQNLRDIFSEWSQTELVLSHESYTLPTNRWKLKRRILFSTVLYLTLSISEHILYLTSNIITFSYAVNFCKKFEQNHLEAFILRHLNFIFVNLPFNYNHILGFSIEYLNFSFTFFWNFLDLFIILISIGINYLYEKLNYRLESLRGLLVNEKVWSEIRLHYVQICELLQFVNSKIGAAVLISSLIDGYFILMQLLNITM